MALTEEFKKRYAYWDSSNPYSPGPPYDWDRIEKELTQDKEEIEEIFRKMEEEAEDETNEDTIRE